MNVVMIIPTGIGCEVGGHAGDATPSAKLLASACNNLIIHPNVVNASDINEMTDNMWYTEGSILDRFLQGQIALEETYGNRILLAVNSPLKNETVNSINAARNTIGGNIDIVQLNTPLTLKGVFGPDGRATGEMGGHEEALLQIKDVMRSNPFDALAIQTVVNVDEETAFKYEKEKGVNPWGGAESVCSKFFARELKLQCAHAPYESGIFGRFNEIVDARLAAEFVSISYLHCILKGLHRAPKIVPYNSMSKATLRIDDIDLLVSPDKCWGPAHDACADWNIPIMFVRENKNIYKDCLNIYSNKSLTVDNYMEAAGVISSIRAGVTTSSVRRPLLKNYSNKEI